MLRPLVVSFWCWITLSPAAVLGLLLLLAYRSRLRGLATVEVCDFLRGADAKRMLTNIIADALMANEFANREFMEGHRRRLHQMRKFLLAVIHDMGILIIWSRRSLHRELVEKPWEKDGVVVEGSETFVEGHRALMTAAKEFRRYALGSLVKVNLALLLCAHWRLRWLTRTWTDVSQPCGRGFLVVYGGVLKTVVEVTALYDEGLPEDFLKALFKFQDPANEIAILRKSGGFPDAPVVT